MISGRGYVKRQTSKDPNWRYLIPAIAVFMGVAVKPSWANSAGVDSVGEVIETTEDPLEKPPTLIVQQLSPEPNRDRFLQPPTEPFPNPQIPPSEPVVTPPPKEPSPPESTVSFPVQKIEVVGSTLFQESDFDSILKPLENRTITLEELRQAAQAITQLYLERGYLTSRALLVDQPLREGVIQIRVVEGKIAQIEVQGTRHLNPDYIRQRVRQGAGVPLNSAKLEEQLRLLQLNPLFERVEASLRPGEGIGESILVLRVTEAKPYGLGVNFDNYSPPSVGSMRTGISGFYRNLTGWGDEFSVSYNRTTSGGADVLDFGYRIPVNAQDGTVALRIAPNWNHVTESPFDEFDIEGNSQLYEISFRQPLVRSLNQEFALSVGFAHQRGQTFLFNDPFGFGIGPDEDGMSRTSVFKFGQDYLHRDGTGAWSVRSQFNFGVDLFDATINDHPTPDGRFFSWLGQVQRVQRLGAKNLLIGALELQLTPNSLLPSQQFVIGGGLSVRGYRQNARSGDNGVRFSLEDRISLVQNSEGSSIFQLAPFVDLGTVWNHSSNPNKLPNQDFLAGIGLGAIWQPIQGLSLRLDYAYPLVDLDDRGDNLQDDGFYFSLNYRL